MNRTTENLLTWAPIGAGLALILSNHKRLGFLVAMVSPTTVWLQHPRATRRALRVAGKNTGKALGRVGQGVGRSAKHAAMSLNWLAS
jgi:hypothetical protein